VLSGVSQGGRSGGACIPTLARGFRIVLSLRRKHRGSLTRSVLFTSFVFSLHFLFSLSPFQSNGFNIKSGFSGHGMLSRLDGKSNFLVHNFCVWLVNMGISWRHTRAGLGHDTTHSCHEYCGVSKGPDGVCFKVYVWFFFGIFMDRCCPRLLGAGIRLLL
jgi:hypothetical protein